MWSSDAHPKLVVSNPKRENMASTITVQETAVIKYKGNLFNDRLIAS
jgi:hypothetical protein